MARPPLATVLKRAAALRCPKCGTGRLFDGFLTMAKICPGCELKYERAPGYFLGSTYINYGLTAVITTVSYVVAHFIYKIPNAQLTPWLMIVVVLVPLLFFRWARSLWLAADCYMDSTGIHTKDPVQ